MSASDWIEFWDNKPVIYVNARHRTAHFRRIAEDIRAYAPKDGAMLDYGCGAALSAAHTAEPTERLVLCDPAPNVRAELAARFAGNSKIDVQTPEAVAAMPDASFNVIVMHSVVQYLSAPELNVLLALFRRLLRPGGLLLLGDIIPHRLSAPTDAWMLLRFGLRNGFFFAAVQGLVRTCFSDYRRLRHDLGLSRYDATDMMQRLDAAGFSAQLARSNIGHNSRRMTFLAHAR